MEKTIYLSEWITSRSVCAASSCAWGVRETSAFQLRSTRHIQRVSLACRRTRRPWNVRATKTKAWRTDEGERERERWRYLPIFLDHGKKFHLDECGSNHSVIIHILRRSVCSSTERDAWKLTHSTDRHGRRSTFTSLLNSTLVLQLSKRLIQWRRLDLEQDLRGRCLGIGQQHRISQCRS